MMKKKRGPSVEGLGYCPFPSCLSHDTVDCIMTQDANGQAGSATIRLDWAMTRLSNVATRPVLGLQHGALHATTRRPASAVCAACAHRLGQGVHLVHPTQF